MEHRVDIKMTMIKYDQNTIAQQMKNTKSTIKYKNNGNTNKNKPDYKKRWRWNTRLTDDNDTTIKSTTNKELKVHKVCTIEVLDKICFKFWIRMSKLQLEVSNRELKLAKLEAERARFFLKQVSCSSKHDY